MSPGVLELEGLSVRLGGRPVLEALECTLSGRAIGLLGPNGAGKTTLIHTLLGFYPPTAGRARVYGHDIAAEPGRIRELVGYMPETDAFVADMTGVRFVRLMAEISGLPPSQALERAHEALFYVGLGEARYRKLGSYSTGMKQLVKLAQAIAHGPRLLLLDEPTNGLDPPARARMLRLVRDIRDSGEAQIVLSSHLLPDVEQCCEEVMVLKEGRLATYCDLEAERRDHRQLFELELVGDQGTFLETVEGLGGTWAASGRRRVRVVLPDQAGVADLYRAAADAEVQIRRLGRQRDSLKDIFLKAMDAPVPEGAEHGRL